MGQTTSHAHRGFKELGKPTLPTSNINIQDTFGLLELAHGENPHTDIVALHGLDGHRENSWTADNGTLWLRDLLPSQIPRARIFSYGYDANTRGRDQLSTASLHTQAMNLITHLASKRKMTSTEERPIIFVAHSLGGIMLKYALIYAHSCGTGHLPSHKAVERSTSGLLFFGTPHQGSKGADLGTVVLNILSAFGKGTPRIVKNIRSDSEMLQQQLIQYQAISASYDTKFYFETYKTPIGPFTELLLVPQSSAIVPGAINAEMVPLNKNHVDMVKFESAEDGAYQLVASHLSMMVAEAPQRIADKWEVLRVLDSVTVPQGAIMKSDLPTSGNISGTIPIADPAPLPMLPYQEAGESLVGRGHVLDWIHEMFKKHRKIVLYGIGGIGKTGIAVEYVYTHRHDYDIIFWVNADTLETTTSGFVVIAQQLVNWKSRYSTTTSSSSGCNYPQVAHELGLNDLLDGRSKISNKMEDRADILNAVKEWLSRTKSGNWLIVFDNADDLDSFDLMGFFPTPLIGRILITSRKQESCSLGAGYEVTALSQDDGVRLLIEKSRTGEADTDAHQIVRMLEGLPLAIELAGAYIAALKLSFKSYLMTSNEPWKYVFTHNIRPYGRSLVAAWEISYRAIEARSLSAANLLLICAFLGSEDIPEQIFQDRFGIATLNEALIQLFAFSLAKRGASETSFSIHPLVHAWARERLDEDQKTEKVTEMVIIIGRVISQMPPSWNHTFILANHALRHCLPKLHANSDMLIFESLEKIAEREGRKLLRGMFRFAFQATVGVNGSDSPETFTAMEMLGCSYFGEMILPVSHFLQNTLQEKERLSIAVLNATSMRPAPTEHYLLAESRGYECEDFCQKEGCDIAERHISIIEQRKAGERLVRCALEGREKVQGSDHADTLHTTHLLAHLMWAQGRSDEAEKLDRRALEGREKILGMDHAHTLETVHNLAGPLYAQGRFAEAETFNQRAFQGREKLLGLDHADTLRSLYALAVSIYAQGRFAEAEKLHRRALEGREKLLGTDHVDTLKSLYGLGLSLRDNGQPAEAEKLHRRALGGREKLFGLDHADTLKSFDALAESTQAQGRFAEAEELHRCALERREKLLGLDHVDTLNTLHHLAQTMHDQGKFDEAETFERRALERREKILGFNHEDTLRSASTLALSMRALDRFEDAEKLEKRVAEARQIAL